MEKSCILRTDRQKEHVFACQLLECQSDRNRATFSSEIWFNVEHFFYQNKPNYRSNLLFFFKVFIQ